MSLCDPLSFLECSKVYINPNWAFRFDSESRLLSKNVKTACSGDHATDIWPSKLKLAHIFRLKKFFGNWACKTFPQALYYTIEQTSSVCIAKFALQMIFEIENTRAGSSVGPSGTCAVAISYEESTGYRKKSRRSLVRIQPCPLGTECSQDYIISKKRCVLATSRPIQIGPCSSIGPSGT